MQSNDMLIQMMRFGNNVAVLAKREDDIINLPYDNQTE